MAKEQKRSKEDQDRFDQQAMLWTFINKTKVYDPPLSLEAGDWKTRNRYISRSEFYTKKNVVENPEDELDLYLGYTSNKMAYTRVWDLDVGSAVKLGSFKRIANNYKREAGKDYPSESEIQEVLNGITTLEMSYLAPYIQFFKYENADKKRKKPYTLRLQTYNSNTIKELFGSSSDSGAKNRSGNKRRNIGGTGIKSANLKYLTSERSGYASNRYSFEVKVLFASFEDMVANIDSTGERNYSALDVLIGFPDRIASEEYHANFHPYRTRVRIGYTDSSIDRAIKDNIATSFVSAKKDKKKAKETFKKVLKGLSFDLEMVCYNWTFSHLDGGKIEATFKYTGADHGAAESEISNILISVADYKEMTKMEQFIAKVAQNKADGKKNVYEGVDKDMKPKFEDFGLDRTPERTMEKKVEEILIKSSSWMVEKMVDRGQIFFAFVASEELKERQEMLKTENSKVRSGERIKDRIVFNNASWCSAQTLSGIRDRAKTDSRQAVVSGKKAGKARSESNKYYTSSTKSCPDSDEDAAPFDKKDMAQMSFFFLGDLIYTAAEMFALNLNESTNTKNKKWDSPRYYVSLDFGNVIFPDFRVPGARRNLVNIADIPISLDYFMVWWNKKVVGAGRRIYKFSEFLRDVFSELVKQVLESSDAMISFKTGKAKANVNPLTNGTSSFNIRVQQTSIQVPDSQSRIIKFYFYYDDQKKASNPKDIITFYYGNSRGIVKRMEFEKEPNALLVSAAMQKTIEQNPQAPKLNHLREVYNSTLTIMGNSYLQPGMRVEIQPSIYGIGDINAENNKPLKSFGLGGLYDLISGELIFDNGKLESILKGRWIGNLEDRIDSAAEAILSNKKPAGSVINGALGGPVGGSSGSGSTGSDGVLGSASGALNKKRE